MRWNDDHVYMMITTDEYELPLAIGNTVKELAEIVGTSKNSILSAISHAKAGRGYGKSCYIKVEFDEEGE